MIVLVLGNNYYLCGVKYDTNIKKSTLIWYLNVRNTWMNLSQDVETDLWNKKTATVVVRLLFYVKYQKFHTILIHSALIWRLQVIEIDWNSFCVTCVSQSLFCVFHGYLLFLTTIVELCTFVMSCLPNQGLGCFHILYLLVFAPHVRKEREDKAKYYAKFSTFLAKVLVNQDKWVILQ